MSAYDESIYEQFGIENSTVRDAYYKDGINVFRRKVVEILEATGDKTWHFYYAKTELHAQLGDKDKALKALNKAFEEHDHRMAQLKVNPQLDNLRSDPRFQELIRRLKLN